MSEKSQSSPESLLRLIIEEVVAAVTPSVKIPPRSEVQAQFNEEIKDLANNENSLQNVLVVLFPNGLPSDLRFYKRLVKLHIRLGPGEATQQLVGLLWARAARKQSTAELESLLTHFSKLENRDFFMLLPGLPILLERVPLGSEFATAWLQAMVKRMGNDIAAGPFWDSLGAFCDTQVHCALEVLKRLSEASDDAAIMIAAYILGTLRALLLCGDSQTEFKRWESWFAGSSVPHQRRLYLRSWVQTCWRGKATCPDLKSLATHVEAGPAEEQQEAFFVFTRIPMIPNLQPELFAFAVEWLDQYSSPDISPFAKHCVVELANLLMVTRRHDCGNLVLSVQPLPRDSKATWVQLESYLVSLLEKDLPSFVSFCTRLAKRNAGGWLEMMQKSRGFELFLSQIHGRDIGALVGELAHSDDVGCRRLALFLFDEADLQALPGPLLDALCEREIRLAFHEAQRNLVHGKAIARFLIAIIPSAVRASKQLQQEIYEELVLQAKNYGGQCREEFSKRAADLPLVKEALEVAEHYYDGLRKVQNSSIGLMDVPGFHRASCLCGRRFSAGVSKGAEEASTFLRLFKHVQLLYGKQWRCFQNGTLGQTSGLQAISSSIEIPRLELIDPEGMALHRLQASISISSMAEGGSGTHLNHEQ